MLHAALAVTSDSIIRGFAFGQVLDKHHTSMPVHLQDTTILFANLPLLTCIYGALWTPFFLFDAAVKAEAFDIGLVGSPPSVLEP